MYVQSLCSSAHSWCHITQCHMTPWQMLFWSSCIYQLKSHNAMLGYWDDGSVWLHGEEQRCCVFLWRLELRHHNMEVFTHHLCYPSFTLQGCGFKSLFCRFCTTRAFCCIHLHGTVLLSCQLWTSHVIPERSKAACSTAATNLVFAKIGNQPYLSSLFMLWEHQTVTMLQAIL